LSALLAGIRVLDFGRYIAGPYCGALLAEYGADVIRIEKRNGSEDRFVAPVGAGGEGANFFLMNRNKRSITFDPMHRDARDVLHKLVTSADVVLANLPDATLKAMGLDYANLCSIKPDIILTTSNAYGQTGPMVKNVGFDGIGQALSGSVYMSGQADLPSRTAVPWVDFSTALHCAFATMAALMERDKSGRGQHVQGSLLGTAVTLASSFLIEQAVIDINRVPTGNRSQTSGPVDIYKTQDGWMLVQVVGNPLYARWAKLMGEPHWLTDPRFASDEARGDNGQIISERMNQWCASRTNAQVVATLNEAKIPCGEVLSPQQTLDHPQVQAMGLLNNIDYPGLPKPAPIASVPIKMSVTEAVPMRRPPLLGEHTDEVLGALGYDAAALTRLRANGVI
jgi:crotonobetainyl-CoA:carnitine CoA-transferase CaiB-like acyl-CoA transferase